MKKLALLLSAVMLFSVVLAGCGSSEESKAKDETKAAATSATQESHTNPVDASWFDDAVFVGDSVTTRLDIACADDPTLLGNAKFVCGGSLGYNNSQWDINQEGNVHPDYKGKTVLAENCAVETGANKVFLMLGMNDIGIYGTDGAMSDCEKLVNKIKKNSPNVTIYIQSVTPMMTTHEQDILNNTLIQELNGKLEEFCKKNNYKYLDIYHAVCDDTGALPLENCGDPEGQGIHFTADACKAWVQYLKDNV